MSFSYHKINEICLKFCVKRLFQPETNLFLIQNNNSLLPIFCNDSMLQNLDLYVCLQNSPLFFRQYYTKMATVQHKKPRNSAGWRWNSNRKRGPASYLRWYISTSLYIENRVESLWTSLCTLPRLRFPYMQELQQGMNQQPCAVLYYSKQAAAIVCAVIFQQWQIQSNFSSYVTLFLGGIVQQARKWSVAAAIVQLLLLCASSDCNAGTKVSTFCTSSGDLIMMMQGFFCSAKKNQGEEERKIGCSTTIKKMY